MKQKSIRIYRVLFDYLAAIIVETFLEKVSATSQSSTAIYVSEFIQMMLRIFKISRCFTDGNLEPVISNVLRSSLDLDVGMQLFFLAVLGILLIRPASFWI